MKEIKLSQGKVATVDDADFDFLNQWKWYAFKSNKTFYAVRNGATGIILMHRVLLEKQLSEQFNEADHRNGNGLDNQQGNLRRCTRAQNSYNKMVPVGSSNYRGVTKQAKKWKAQIRVDGKKHLHLGCFDTPKDAAIKYNEAAKLYHGEFAILNQI